MFRLLYFLVVIVSVIVLIDVLRSNKSSEKKVIWVIAVLLLPLVGSLLWYVLEKKK